MSVIAPSAVVLAGGRGARMGQPKAALKFGDSSLLDIIVGRLRKAFHEIVVVGPPPPAADLKPSDSAAARVITDTTAYEGPLTAMKHGLEAVQGDPVFVCSCDLPMLSVMVASELCSIIGDYDALIPEVGGKLQTLHAAYRKRCAGVIDRLISSGERRVAALAEAIRVRKIGEHHLRLLDPGLMSFFNVNTPDDYLAALQMGGFPH